MEDAEARRQESLLVARYDADIGVFNLEEILRRDRQFRERPEVFPPRAGQRIDCGFLEAERVRRRARSAHIAWAVCDRRAVRLVRRHCVIARLNTRGEVISELEILLRLCFADRVGQAEPGGAELIAYCIQPRNRGVAERACHPVLAREHRHGVGPRCAKHRAEQHSHNCDVEPHRQRSLHIDWIDD